MSDDYEVGYGKPPKHTRFQKGRSGNPKGRAKGNRNLATELVEELDERVVIREGGKQVRVTKRRAMIKRLTAQVAQGDLKAWPPLMQLLDKLPPDTSEDGPTENLSDEDSAILEAFEQRICATKGDGDDPLPDCQNPEMS